MTTKNLELWGRITFFGRKDGLGCWPVNSFTKLQGIRDRYFCTDGSGASKTQRQ